MKNFGLKSIFFFLIILLLTHMAVVDSGLCFREGRWPKKLEIVDTALFGDKAKVLSFEQKSKYAEDKYKSKYPEFCRVNNRPFEHGKFVHYTNLIFGLKFFEVECIYPLKDNDPRADIGEKYYISMTSVDACASKAIRGSGKGAVRSDGYIRKNNEFWHENE